MKGVLAMLFMPFDELFLVLVLPAILFSMWAQYKVTSSFGHYSKQRTRGGLTGANAAREVLKRAGVSGVRIERISGNLTDHFDPSTNVIRLSDSVHDAASVAAVGVAAHEAGHAIQYASSYAPMRFRAAIIPVTNIGSKLSVPLILAGLILGFTGLINLGILLFGAVVLFQLVTLPVEYNASSRAMKTIEQNAILEATEMPGARKVLNAAALTYVAALIVSLLQILRFLAIARRR